jgi:hypothetical protein
MFIALSFVGTLPSYIIECIYQTRLYFYGDIYLIIDDIESKYLEKIHKYNIQIINYMDVIDTKFIEIVNVNMNKFCIIENLKGREQLFIRSFERFFLLHNLLKQKNITDCLFLELDNLIYDNPEKWIERFSKKELCYMYDNDDRCSSGLMYVKKSESLDLFLAYILYYIINSNEFLNEMTTLYRYYERNNNDVQILPTYYNKESIPNMAIMNYDNYNSIFDALAIGCLLLGLDPYHTDGKIELGRKAWWCAIDYTKDIFEWKIDDKGRRNPYIFDGNNWIKINNLHVHSKDLKSGLSLPMEENP